MLFFLLSFLLIYFVIMLIYIKNVCYIKNIKLKLYKCSRIYYKFVWYFIKYIYNNYVFK